MLATRSLNAASSTGDSRTGSPSLGRTSWRSSSPSHGERFSHDIPTLQYQDIKKRK